MTRFVFAAALPEGNGWYAHYDHARLDVPGWKECDVRAAVGAHQDEWFEDLEAWHVRLCEAGARRSRDFWLTSISRLNIWMHGDMLRPLFYAAGLCAWGAEHPDVATIVVLNAPPDVAAYVAEFTRQQDATARGVPWVRASVAGAAAMARRLLRLADHAWRRRPAGRATVLLYSQVVDARSLEEVGDHFFGRFVGDLERDLGANLGVTYLLRDELERQRVDAYHAARGTRASFLLDYVSLLDLLRVAARTLRAAARLAALARHVSPLTLGPYTSRDFLRRWVAVEVLRRLPDVEVAVHVAMTRALEMTGATTVVYPYEEKGLERAIVAAADRRPPVATLGFAHAAHTRCHLALRTRRAGNAPAPTGILATGPLAGEFLVKWAGKDSASLVAVGSPRHLVPLAAVRSRDDRRSALRVLIVITFGWELEALGAWLERAPRLFDGCEAVIRQYRFGWFSEQERGLRRVLAAAPALAAREGSLSEQLEWSDLVVFCSTTTGVQAMLAGRLVAYAALHDLFAMDPLLGEPGVFARCPAPATLGAALARARELDDAGVTAAIDAQRALAARILAPPDPGGFVATVREASAPR